MLKLQGRSGLGRTYVHPNHREALQQRKQPGTEISGNAGHYYNRFHQFGFESGGGACGCAWGAVGEGASLGRGAECGEGGPGRIPAGPAAPGGPKNVSLVSTWKEFWYLSIASRVRWFCSVALISSFT